MKSAQIRTSFVDFFKDRGHQLEESSPLVPQNDPTLLFANAGMNQFKDFFTGKTKAQYPRAVTVQKCVRAGGKHNDLENVGLTARHHTFFEMLGNFSFGDYFKKEAIEFAWEFVTKSLSIEPEKLFITVHYTDDEAWNIWREHIGIPESHLFKRGDKDNFWEMGDVGPCGPCSEIFFDHGESFSDGEKHEQIIDDESRYVEIWNLVFMQFEKHADGTQSDLPSPCVDTGAGLERLAAVCQGVYWNYETDSFTPILRAISSLVGQDWQQSQKKSSFQVVADHMRSTTMLITDGVLPSNEGRGYVLRRIIRRAVRHLRELGLGTPGLHLLVDSVFEALGSSYPQNEKNAQLAKKMLKIEEEKFRQTLDQGLETLTEYLSELQGTTLEGSKAFKLYDTFGFPLDLTQTLLEEKGLSLDEKGFHEAMQAQREKSRASKSFKASSDDAHFLYQQKEKAGDTRFVGHTDLHSVGKLVHTFHHRGALFVCFDQTPFYPESGGQVGDTGSIEFQNGTKLKIIDTQRPVENFIIHQVNDKQLTSDIAQDPQLPKIGESAALRVDAKRRGKIVKNHSATHLLQAALVEVLGEHVKQAGSHVGPERLRFDFTHPEALSEQQKVAVESRVNHFVREGSLVDVEVMPKEKAIAAGAKALFGEKYGKEVRTIRMGSASFELCGGTHVGSTSEIGAFVIVAQSSLSSGVRRIEALSSDAAFDFLNLRHHYLDSIEKLVGGKNEKAVEKVEQLQQKMKDLKKASSKPKKKAQLGRAEILKSGVDFLFQRFEEADVSLGDVSDQFVQISKKGVGFFTKEQKGKFQFVLRTQKSSGIDLKRLFAANQSIIGAKGGGRPDMIQGSFERVAGIQDFTESIKKALA